MAEGYQSSLYTAWPIYYSNVLTSHQRYVLSMNQTLLAHDTRYTVNLNMGAGSNRKQDFKSVDLYTDADIQWDLTEPLPLEDGQVDNIFASHVIEHFSKAEWADISKEWARVLKPGGTIEIYCPDIIQACLVVAADLSRLNIIYGNQDTPGEFHKNGFTYKTLCDSFPGFYGELLEPTTDYELHVKLTKEM
jgi:predicted SAM-dependent methyltransferase